MRSIHSPASRAKTSTLWCSPNLSSANGAYKLLQGLNPEAEIIGPIQMGLNKPIHFTDSESSVQDIVNITAVAVIDAYVEKIKKQK